MHKICLQQNILYTSLRRVFFYWTMIVARLYGQTKRFIRKMREEDFVSPTNLPPRGWGVRHIVFLLCFTGSAMSYAMRFNLSIAIVAMVNRTHLNSLSSPTSNPHSGPHKEPLRNVACAHLIQLQDYSNFSQNSVSEPESGNIVGIQSGARSKLTSQKLPVEDDGEFLWTEAEQGVILGSFFWGYILTQFPGGLISKRFGPKWPFGFGMLVFALCTLATPWAARMHKNVLIFVRIIEGLASGMQISCQTALIAAWSPLNERSFIATFVHGGTFVGTAVVLVISGYLIEGTFLGGGWQSIFYTCGLATIVWFMFWALFVHNSPSQHPKISNEERNYIQTSMGSHGMSDRTDIQVPWKEILFSGPIWANVVAHICHCWGIYTLLTEMPTYFRTVLHFDIKKNAWLSAVPYLLSWLCGLLFANMADVALRKSLVKIINVRKTAQILAHGFSALALIAVSYSGCHPVASVSFLIMAITFLGISNSGYIINYVDLSPQFASIVVGAVNMIANLCGIFAPYFAGQIINNDPSVENWKTVYLCCAAVLLFSSMFYTVFASGSVQPWNNYQKLREDHDHEHNLQADAASLYIMDSSKDSKAESSTTILSPHFKPSGRLVDTNTNNTNTISTTEVRRGVEVHHGKGRRISDEELQKLLRTH